MGAQASMQGVKQGKTQFTDPITSTEAELKRINAILATPAVAPPSANQMAQLQASPGPPPGAVRTTYSPGMGLLPPGASPPRPPSPVVPTVSKQQPGAQPQQQVGGPQIF